MLNQLSKTNQNLSSELSFLLKISSFNPNKKLNYLFTIPTLCEEKMELEISKLPIEEKQSIFDKIEQIKDKLYYSMFSFEFDNILDLYGVLYKIAEPLKNQLFQNQINIF